MYNHKKSGLLGISGKSSDIRELKELRDAGDEMAKLALDMQVYRVKKYIGSYMAVLGHVDVITFEGGIGEYNDDLVFQILEGLEELGIKADPTVEYIRGAEQEISAKDSKIKIFKIPTDEELMIARDTLELVTNK